VSASRIVLDVGRNDRTSIVGLTVDGKRVAAGTKRIPVKRWGYVVTATKTPVTAAGGHAIGALAVHLVEPHAGLPAGTVVVVALAGSHAKSKAAARKRRKHKQRATHEPLTVTPKLGQRRFDFPVVGAVSFGDTYGAFRGDVPGDWHHGDDIFAPLGTPVVAVASGTINRVGWEAIGGWRMWVRDDAGDEFYYAHLSGYAPSDLRSNRVRAGEVIGFVGNTGDAFTTSPHLHFEVHPRPLLHLGYDGAVDPTTYLDGWQHLGHVEAPVPVHPPLPTEPLIRKEAVYVFGELLAARHLIKHAPAAKERPHIALPSSVDGVPAPSLNPVRASASAPLRHGGGLSTLTIALVAGLGSLALVASTVFAVPALRRRL